jgi:uncharacterized protein (DUF58 family)
MRAFIRQHLDSWLFRLGKPEAGEVFLNQRRVFIIPGLPGLAFGVMLLVLFIGSVNYNLSLGFGLTFLLAACAIIDMHLTFRNLAHLYLAPGRTRPVFAGEEALFELQVTNRSRHDRYAIWLGFHDTELPARAQSLDIPSHASRSVKLGLPASRRGWLAAPRVRLQTRFPLGLLRCWSYWRPAMQVLVYPQPEQAAPPLPQAGIASQEGSGAAGQEDFAGIRAYQSGDSPKQLSWRHIARTDTHADSPLVSKHFEGGGTGDLLLDFSALPPHLDTEQRLSRLTRWVQEAEAQGTPYAFRIGPTEFPAALGAAHQAACLRALALYAS